jgi:hypothetical protein
MLVVLSQVGFHCRLLTILAQIVSIQLIHDLMISFGDMTTFSDFVNFAARIHQHSPARTIHTQCITRPSILFLMVINFFTTIAIDESL